VRNIEGAGNFADRLTLRVAAQKKCLDPFFADRFQRLVERCLIGRK
jgi:hypothetical protein